MKLLKLLSACSIALMISACSDEFPEYPVKVIRVVVARADGTQASLACDLVNSKDVVYKCQPQWDSITAVNGWFCMSAENKQQLEQMYLDAKDKYKLCKTKK